MYRLPSVMLFVDNRPLLASLQFALSLEGFEVTVGAERFDPRAAGCIVVDQDWHSDGLAFIAEARDRNCPVPSIFLATNPTPIQHNRAAALGAIIVEKPLIGDELTEVLRGIVRNDRVEA